MDTNMVEYYQQIGELRKAVRERELHRLELEKQVLQSAQRRERRHEDFKDKIREIQKELAQKEREATHNFQSLLARVDSIRREHQLLAAHTEQLRQRKLQYEMNLRSADPLLHTAVHQDLSGIFKDSDGELWKGHLQANSTPNSKSHQQPTLPLQHLLSPIPSYNNNYNMSTQPIDQHISSGAIRTKEHNTHGIPIGPSMQSKSLMEEPLPQNREFSLTHHGDVIKTPSAHNLPPYMGHRIPSHDISGERHPQSGMDLRPHTNVDKTSAIHTQSSTSLDYRTPQALGENPIMSQVLTDPLTYDGSPQSSGAITSTITHNQPSPRYYNMPQVSRGSETQSQSNATPLTYIHPSQANISENASRIFHQNHPPYQPARRDPLDYNRNRNPSTVPIHSSDELVPNNSSSSIPGNLQRSPYLGDAEAYYLKQLHSSIYPQNPSVTASPKTDRYHPNLDDRFPPGTTNGVSYYSPAISRSETGLENKSMNPSSPHLNNVDPQYEKRYDRESLTSADLHSPPPNRSNSLLKREVPEKDTVSRLSLTSPALQDDKMHNAIGEDGLTKTRAMSDVDEKLKEITPQKYFDARTQNDNPTKDETKKYENHDLTNSRSFAHIYDENSDKANNNQRTPISTAPINTSSSWTPLKKPDSDIKTRMEPSLVSTSRSADSVRQEEYPKSSEVQISNEKSSGIELKPEVNISRDVNEYKEGMVPIIPEKETKTSEIQPDKHYSSPKDPPFLQTIKDSPERQTSLSKSSPSSVLIQNSTIRSTSVLEPTQDERKYSDGHLTSKESPVSPPTKMDIKDTTPTSVLPSKVKPLQNVEDSDTDFFDQNINVTGSAAYRSLMGDSRKGSVTSENDETERQVAGMISKPQTPLSRPSFRSFASSIPSLRPAPPETDTDSVDSVEAAIQAAMKNKDQETTAPTPADSSGELSNLKSSSLQPETTLENPEVKRGLVHPGTDKATDQKKSSTSAALAINLDSESESYEVSAGGGASDEDDFDFYDKF